MQQLLRRTLLVLLAPLGLACGQAQSWSWFVEPFSVRVATTHAVAGPIEGLLVVGADAVRNEWQVPGGVSTTIIRLDGAGAIMWTLLPDGTYLEQALAYADAPDLFDQGYVAAVTAPDDARHVCVVSPEVHRCAFEGNEEVDGRALERWRIDAVGAGEPRGQWFWFDRSAGVVVRALDDTGADLRFFDHRRGPAEPGAFEVPSGYRRL